jgi:hypothetical protein
MHNDACISVRITVRRMVRHPITQKTIRSGALLRKHVVRGATLGLVPNAVNDVVFHHAPFDISEVIHLFQDTATVTTMNALVAVIVTASKVL